MIRSDAACRISSLCSIRSVRHVSKLRAARAFARVRHRSRAPCYHKCAKTYSRLRPSCRTLRLHSGRRPSLSKTTARSYPTRPKVTTWTFWGMRRWPVCIPWWVSLTRRSRRWYRLAPSLHSSWTRHMPFSICSYQGKTQPCTKLQVSFTP